MFNGNNSNPRFGIETKPDARDFLPKRKEYSSFEERKRTFEGWPVVFLTAERLAAAGFWYLGEGDRVRCFFCGGGVRNWLPEDDPMSEHRRIFPTCGFVSMATENGDEQLQSINIKKANKSRL
ncbi:unnamed protein product [Lymnaea stagnalis]|uniref:Uncharacterized protein n=1 Tax=Lymnaea stagnalis TaxID=6523 RepID=A0AAV2HXD4_LYMST